MDGPLICKYCQEPFVPRDSKTGGRPQRFCCPACKMKYRYENMAPKDHDKNVDPELITRRDPPPRHPDFEFIQVPGNDWPLGKVFTMLDVRYSLMFCVWPVGAVARKISDGRRYEVIEGQKTQLMKPLDGGIIIRPPVPEYNKITQRMEATHA